MNAGPRPPTTAESRAHSALAALPTLAVLGLIGAVGYWGHSTGWKAPQFSHLFGLAPGKAAADWCATHNVPDSRCIACHPELAGENGADWCKEHGVPESKCTTCHPEILTTGVAGDWCAEHGLPESGCTICHPEIARKGALPVDASAVTVSNGSHASERPEDHPAGATSPAADTMRNSRTCQKHALKVQFASVAAMEKCGIRLGQVVERPMSDSVFVNAEVDYDRTRFARLAPRVSGTAWRVEHGLGEVVKAGDVLALIESGEAGRAKAELLQAQVAVDVTVRAAERARSSSEAGFRTEAERIEAEAKAREAEIRLFNARQSLANLGLATPSGNVDASRIATLGLPEHLIAQLSTGTPSANLIPLSAPLDGVIVARTAVTGEIVEPSRALFEIADTSRMWVTMDVPQTDAHRIAIGEEVIFRPDDARDEVVAGRLAWIATAVDEMTRTVKVRADVSNTTGGLRAHSFGRAQIVVRTSPNAIAVPTEAVQWEGCCYVVFVRISDDIFQTRKVRLGAKDAAYTEIQGGVLPGEIVVTVGSHVLKSEILKSNLGAGCTDD